MCITLSKLMPISQIIVEIWLFLDFSRWRLFAIFDLFYTLAWAIHVLGGFYHRAKFGWNQPCSFEVSMLCEFCLKMRTHAHFKGVLGVKMGETETFFAVLSS